MRKMGIGMLAVAALLECVVPAMAKGVAPSVAGSFGANGPPMLVVAHRACHSPTPRHGDNRALPENSLAGIARCAAIGVDVAEVDVRRTRDGYLVLMHDETVDRTTDGHGPVADLTLADIQGLRLRQNEGGSHAYLTQAHVPTLDEAFAAARGRILLNLDVQAGLFVDVIAAVVRAGAIDQVIIKEPTGSGSPIAADTVPFDLVPFMPILTSAGDNKDLPLIARRQSEGRVKPIAFELPRMTPVELPAISRIAKRAGIRLWANSLWEGFILGYGGDIDALRDPSEVWGRMRREGIDVIQTDEPEALLKYLGR